MNSRGLGIASPGAARDVDPFALSLIEDFESWSPVTYEDASGYCTIGYGHLIAKARCASSQDKVRRYATPLDRGKGEALLNEDMAGASSGVTRLVTVHLTDAQFGALTSFVFNVGPSQFEHSDLRKYVNEENATGVVRELARWHYANHKSMDGLILRRSCEAALFVGKIPMGDERTFSRKQCESLGIAPASGDPIEIETGESIP